jgi:UDP-N-acetylenolpyruvoylglucosamine reductase
MLIDDHPLIVSAMQRILRELDLQTAVVTAGSAAAAREVLQADASFDLLLLDLALPDIDGHAFLGELRRTHPSLPVVVVSASERAADVVRAIDANLGGLECLSGIPGSAGATPVQNVGAYGVEVADLITRVRLLDRRTAEVAWVPAAELGFGYRHSVLKNSAPTNAAHAVVLEVRPLDAVRQRR